MKSGTRNDQNKVRLDLNNPVFQEDLFALQKTGYPLKAGHIERGFLRVI